MKMRVGVLVFSLIVLPGLCLSTYAFQPDGYLQPRSQQLRLAIQIILYQEMVEQQQWVLFPGGTVLQKGDTGLYVTGLRRNLHLLTDLQDIDSSNWNTAFDTKLENALKQFQLRHGLQPDGIVGQQTLEALNVSPAQRLQQIRTNLKRWISDTSATDQPVVFVNVPDYTLHLLDATGAPFWRTRVVVGQTGKAHQTVVPLEDSISYMVLNPSWNIPKSIIRAEIIPIMRKDRNYLAQNHMKVYRQQGKERVLIPITSINWHTADPETDNFMVIQEPGSWNAMGKIKFMFPNVHAIYLHDTPARSLFAHWRRAYSHGCVRVQHPEKLAAFLLSSEWGKSIDQTQLFHDKTLDKVLLLPKPIRIKIRYYTSWVDEAGILQFRKDIYHLDAQP